MISAHPFNVNLTAHDPRTGTEGEGQVIAHNDIYGIFSIPTITGNAANPEVIVKMVDASGIGQNYWVFYAALTDLNYTLAVKESATGRTKSYNDAKVGTTVCGKFDTAGFEFTATPTVTPTGPGATRPTPTPTLTPTPTPTHSGSTVIVNVAQGGAMNFSPSVVAIHVGDTVQWDFRDTRLLPLDDLRNMHSRPLLRGEQLQPAAVRFELGLGREERRGSLLATLRDGRLIPVTTAACTDT